MSGPIVFLSHSSKDKPFIKRLAADLKMCKVGTWLDSEEIRDGKSFIDAIFLDGIPRCNSVIIYLTENVSHIG